MSTSGRIFKKLWAAIFVSLTLVSFASAQGTGNAPARPECTEAVPCDFNAENGLAGARVILFESGGGHGTSKGYLRDALTRLSNQYGFIYDRRNSPTDFTEQTLSDAKVIIYSNNDGAGMPSGSQAQLIENFVRQRGWGLLMIHAACAFNGWQFLQDACIQQYHHHYPEQTRSAIYVEENTYQGTPHGRSNPYSSFLLEDIEDRQTLNDEWYSWRGNPRTTHEFNRQSQNKIMLTGIDESTIQGGSCPDCNLFPSEHYVAWTHTMGEGIVLYNSTGHSDTYQQSTDDFGDEFLWRSLRYVAKDWGTAAPPLTKVCNDPEAGNIVENFDPNTMEADESLCKYCGDESAVNYVAGKNQTQYDNSLCEVIGINISGFKVNEFITTENLSISVTYTGEYNLKILKANGELILNENVFGAKVFSNPVKEAGIYYIRVSATGYHTSVRKILVK